MKTETYLLPDYFAPYLINGDDSALENNELLAIDSFLAERNVTAGECMDAVDAGFHKWNELGAMARLEGNCMEYTFPVIKGAKGVF